MGKFVFRGHIARRPDMRDIGLQMGIGFQPPAFLAVDAAADAEVQTRRHCFCGLRRPKWRRRRSPSPESVKVTMRSSPRRVTFSVLA